jgi:hypothetical protein
MSEILSAGEWVRRRSRALDLTQDVQDFESRLAEAHTRTDAASFTAAWEAGRSLSLEQVTAEALALADVLLTQ